MNAEKTKASKRKYRLSKKGIATELRYNESKKGKTSRKKARLKYHGSEKSNARFRRHKLKKAYGLTIEQYEELFIKQRGCCAICGGTNKYGRRLAVDHHHTTGEIRGLLCNQCNRALGYFHDDIARLASAIKYLSGGA